MRKASLLTIFLIVFIDLVGFGILLPNQQYYGETFGITNIFFLTLYRSMLFPLPIRLCPHFGPLV